MREPGPSTQEQSSKRMSEALKARDVRIMNVSKYGNSFLLHFFRFVFIRWTVR
jgi:hypothetical protein